MGRYLQSTTASFHTLNNSSFTAIVRTDGLSPYAPQGTTKQTKNIQVSATLRGSGGWGWNLVNFPNTTFK